MDFLPPAKRACLAIRTYGVLVQVHTYAYAHYRSLIRIYVFIAFVTLTPEDKLY